MNLLTSCSLGKENVAFVFEGCYVYKKIETTDQDKKILKSKKITYYVDNEKKEAEGFSRLFINSIVTHNDKVEKFCNKNDNQ